MTPWSRERRIREAIKWMYEENPEIWYTPAGVTEQNPHYPYEKLKIEEAVEIYKDLEERGLINPVYPIVEFDGKGKRESGVISAWQVDNSRTGEIWAVINGGDFDLYVMSVFRFLWTKKSKAWILFITAIGIVITGFLARLGEQACISLFGFKI